MRVSENSLVQEFLFNLERSRERWAEWNRQVATGKKIHAPSDSPADSARVMRIRDEVSRINQYYRNAGRARAKLGNASSALNSLRNTVIQITERAGFAVTGTTSPENRVAIANELKGVLAGLIQVARTSVDGLYLFSGSTVDRDPLAEVNGDWVYQGNDGVMQIEVSPGERIQVNVPGSEVFSDSETDLINFVQDLIEQLEADDVDGAKVSMDAIARAGKVIDLARFKISQGLNRIESSEQRLNDRMFDLTAELSNTEDADMAQAISRMTQSETAMRASLAAGARLQQGNLFDYLG